MANTMKLKMRGLGSLIGNTTNGIISILLTSLIFKFYENHDGNRFINNKKDVSLTQKEGRAQTQEGDTVGLNSSWTTCDLGDLGQGT